MGDFVPNRNFSQKSIESPAKSPTTQMSKFVDVCNIWSKFKKNKTKSLKSCDKGEL